MQVKPNASGRKSPTAFPAESFGVFNHLRLLGQRNLRFREVRTGSAGLQNVVRQASDGTMGCRGCFQEVLKGEIPSIDAR